MEEITKEKSNAYNWNWKLKHIQINYQKHIFHIQQKN